MSDKKFYEDSSFWAGFGLYYVLSWIFPFYPSIVSAIWVSRLFENENDKSASFFWTLVLVLVGIIVLKKYKQYFLVIFIYISTFILLFMLIFGY